MLTVMPDISPGERSLCVGNNVGVEVCVDVGAIIDVLKAEDMDLYGGCAFENGEPILYAIGVVETCNLRRFDFTRVDINRFNFQS